MSYLLDTNHCIYLQNGLGKKPEKRKIEEINAIKNIYSIETKDNIFMSVVTLGELFFGASYSQNKEGNLKRLEVLKDIIIPIDLDIEIWEIFGELKGNLKKQGKLISDFDLLIACTAKIYHYSLVTNDKDFDNLPSNFIEKLNWTI